MTAQNVIDTAMSVNTAQNGQDTKFVACYYYSSKDGQYFAMRDDEETTVISRFKNQSSVWNIITGELPRRIIGLAVQAINNRTRERNFARLNSNLAMGIISEKEFDEELSNNEDKYVVKCDKMPTEPEIKASLQLASEIMDVNDTDDLSVLFSFNESALSQYLIK